MKTDYIALAEALQARLPYSPIETMNARVWANEDGVYVEPEVGEIMNVGSSVHGGSLYCVEAVMTFAKYHGLDVSTRVFTTGAGLWLS